VKTIIAGQPLLSHYQYSCQPENNNTNMCFEVLGFDILLDEKLKPWLLEVNHTPSFETDTPLDFFIKKNMIADTFKLINLSYQSKKKILNQRKQEIDRRVFTGKRTRLSMQER